MPRFTIHDRIGNDRIARLLADLIGDLDWSGMKRMGLTL